MKSTIFIISLIFTLHTSFAGRFYSPNYGRWLNRDPIGVQGGTNVYNSVSNNMVNGFSGGMGLISGMEFIPVYFGENLYVDPFGYAIGIIEISKEETAGVKGLVYNDHPVYKNVIKEYKRYVKDFTKILTDRVNKFKKFNTFENGVKAGTIKWNGEKFNGTFEEYIALLEREQKSFVLLQQGKFQKNAIKDAIGHLNKLTGDFNKKYDQVGIAVHGIQTNTEVAPGEFQKAFNNDIVVLGKFLNQQKQLIKFLKGKLKDFKSNAKIISCGQDGKSFEEIKVQFDSKKTDKSPNFKKIDGKHALTVEFTPISFKIIKTK